MADPSATPGADTEAPPPVSPTSLAISLHYLLKKKLSYLAVVAVALSVGTLIVVMSVFSGFHIQLTSAIRGYLSDLKVRPLGGGLYAMNDWQAWRQKALTVENVVGAAPYIQGAGLIRERGTGRMIHVLFKGVHPELEGTVASLPEYMVVGRVEDLRKTYSGAEGGRLRSCFLGAAFFGGEPPRDLDRHPLRIVLVTATPDLRLQLKKYAVNGVFRTGNNDYDSRVVILGLEAAGELVESGGEVSGLSVRLDDYEKADETRKRLAEALSPGAILRTFQPEAAERKLIALSADGGRLAAASHDRVRVWAADSGQQLLEQAGSAEITSLALDDDGDRLFVGLKDGPARLYEVESGKELRRLDEEGATATARFFQSYLLALGYRSGRLRILEMGAGELADVEAHEGAVRDVAFEDGGGRLLTVGDDGAARLWEAETGRRLRTLKRSGGPALVRCGIAPDKQTAAGIDADGLLHVWDLGTGAELARQQVEQGRPLALDFGWTSRTLVAAGTEAVGLWKLQAGAAGRAALYGSIQRQVPAAAAGIGADGKRTLLLRPDGRLDLRHTGPGFRVTTWEEERKTFLEAVAMEQFLQALIMSLILVLAEFLIFSIVTTMVNERRRDIGILQAVGFTRWQICQVFLACGLVIGVVGTALGVTGGVLFARNINPIRELIRETIHWDPFPPTVYYFTEIPAHVGLVTPIIVGAGAIVCSLLFSLVPAVRAARMDPVETLYYE